MAKVAIVLLVGFLCIVVGINGQLGSIIGAIIDPAAMQMTAGGAAGA